VDQRVLQDLRSQLAQPVPRGQRAQPEQQLLQPIAPVPQVSQLVHCSGCLALAAMPVFFRTHRAEAMP
jgi:hypothetical protein